MTNNIELELRAELSLEHLDELIGKFDKVERTKRLSVMFLGKIGEAKYDIRIRIDSKNHAEFVVKKGDFHSHDRLEVSQKITKDQFIGMVKIFSLFGFQSKVTERENSIVEIENGIILSFVKAGSISYVEIEKMSNEENLEENKLKLLEIVEKYGLNLIKDETDFNELCGRLTKLSDWSFENSEEQLRKLTSLLESY